jgi:hypothetical protein
MSTIYWAGIGSRETPLELKPTIQRVVEICNDRGLIMRSGAAPGADSFFEEHSLPTLREIYLPWRGFNGNTSSLYQITDEALAMAEKYHPGWYRLSQGAKKLMARNCYQVLGFDLNTPVDFIVCWTRDGKASGGTGQAIRLATDYNIPVFNLKNSDALINFFKHVQKINLQHENI